MRMLDRTRTVAALLALALAVVWAPGAGLADDDNDNDKKKDNKRKQETAQQRDDGEATVVCCLPAQSSTSATIQRTGRPGTTNRPPIVTGDTVMTVTAGATGDGAADDDECDRWAGLLNDLLDLMDEALLDDNDAVHANALEGYKQVKNAAEDRGCFIVE